MASTRRLRENDLLYLPIYNYNRQFLIRRSYNLGVFPLKPKTPRPCPRRFPMPLNLFISPYYIVHTRSESY